MSLGALIYFFLLALWSAVVSYLLLFKLVPLMKRHVADGTHIEAIQTHVPEHKPTHHAPVTERTTYSTHEGFSSLKTGENLSVEDIVKAFSRGDRT